MSGEIKDKDYEENVEDNVNIVGIHKSKKLFVVVLVCIVTGLMYYFFFRGDKETENLEEPKKVVEQQNIEKLLKESETPAQETSPRILTPPPKLPELPPLVMPSVPDIPMITKPVKHQKPEPEEEDDEEEEDVYELPSPYDMNKHSVEEKRDLSVPTPYGIMSPERTPSFLQYDRERRSTPMITIGGGDSGGGYDTEEGTSKSGSFGIRDMENTPYPTVRTTRVGDPKYVIIQGNVIDAVLETAINSDIPGVLRAIVSRDVYADAGNKVMIPKGSRLIGSYFFDPSGTSFRVSVSWSRVILPSGVDIQINSGGTDELGRNGIVGTVDTKVGAALTSTILLAGVSLGTAFATSKIPGLQSEIVDTEKTKEGKEDSEKKTSSNLPVKIVSDAVKDFSESIKSIIKKYSSTTPTIYVDQGTVMKVFVNQDIAFPREVVIR